MTMEAAVVMTRTRQLLWCWPPIPQVHGEAWVDRSMADGRWWPGEIFEGSHACTLAKRGMSGAQRLDRRAVWSTCSGLRGPHACNLKNSRQTTACRVLSVLNRSTPWMRERKRSRFLSRAWSRAGAITAITQTDCGDAGVLLLGYKKTHTAPSPPFFRGWRAEGGWLVVVMVVLGLLSLSRGV